MSNLPICFICQQLLKEEESSRKFKLKNRVVTIHEECLQILGNIVQEALVSIEISTIPEALGVRESIQELVQRDSNGLFTIASKKIFQLAAREAVATALYVELRPLTVSEIVNYLRRFYKEVPLKSASIYLTARDTSTSIRFYVRRVEEGYELNEQGIKWFEKRVAPKILGNGNEEK